MRSGFRVAPIFELIRGIDCDGNQMKRQRHPTKHDRQRTTQDWGHSLAPHHSRDRGHVASAGVWGGCREDSVYLSTTLVPVLSLRGLRVPSLPTYLWKQHTTRRDSTLLIKGKGRDTTKSSYPMHHLSFSSIYVPLSPFYTCMLMER